MAPLGVDVIASALGPISTGFAARANMHVAQALPATVVARVTMQALGNKTTVRPGWLSKLLDWSLATLPRWGQVYVITQVMKGMRVHQGQNAERGIANLSLRDVARKLGVSHQAPCQHYRSRDHLLAEVMRRCFRRLAAHLDARPRFDDPEKDLESLTIQYLDYAHQHPLEYRVMFSTT